jgi:hypothetical protein
VLPFRFGTDHYFLFRDVVEIESAAHRENDLRIFFPRDLEHGSSRRNRAIVISGTSSIHAPIEVTEGKELR